MNEEWKSIEGYPNYDVSNSGKVRRALHTKKGWGTFPGKILKQSINVYCYVVLIGTDKHPVHIAVHQLVLHHFKGDCPEKCEPDHKDKNRQNNQINNLEWKNVFDNRSNKGEANGGARLKEDQVREIKRLLLTCTKRGPINPFKIAKMFGVNRNTILRIQQNKHWRHVTI